MPRSAPGAPRAPRPAGRLVPRAVPLTFAALVMAAAPLAVITPAAAAAACPVPSTSASASAPASSTGSPAPSGTPTATPSTTPSATPSGSPSGGARHPGRHARWWERLLPHRGGFEGDAPHRQVPMGAGPAASGTSGTTSSATSSATPGTTPTGASPSCPPGGGTGGGTGGSAAQTQGWGDPIGADEFDGTAVDASRWSVYDGPGHAGNGCRCPDQVTVSDGVLTIAGEPNGDSGGMAWKGGQKYGRWEARMRVTSDGGGNAYHPVLLLWPDSERWPDDGEIDYAETDAGSSTMEAFLHYGDGSDNGGQHEYSTPADLTQWHDYAVEWTGDHIAGYVDGRQWFDDTSGEVQPPGPMHATIQLDDFFPGGGLAPAKMQVDWMHVYGPDSSGAPTGGPTTGNPTPSMSGTVVTPTGTSSPAPTGTASAPPSGSPSDTGGGPSASEPTSGPPTGGGSGTASPPPGSSSSSSSSSSSGGGGGSTGDGTTAAGTLGWGTPAASDEFDGSAVDASKWGVYDGPGHAGNGCRCPGQVTVSGGVLTIAGEPNGDSGGMAWKGGQKYGRWEARMRVTSDGGGNAYHPVLLLWPDAENWPVGGEVDYAETDAGSSTMSAFLHYGASNQQHSYSTPADLTQWHNYAVEWNGSHIAGYVDGQKWFDDTSGEVQPPGPMHATIQLDDFFPGGGLAPAKMQVDWMRIYGA